MSDPQNGRNNLVEPFDDYIKGCSHDKIATVIFLQQQMSGSDGAIATAIYLLQSMGCMGLNVVCRNTVTPCAHPKNRDGFKYIAGHALVGIYNIRTNGAQQTSVVKPVLNATLSGQFIALQATNALKETISG